MALPISYNVRNVRNRWQVTLLAVSGIALVVAVFTVLMAMSEGFAIALRSTGRPDNAMVIQRGSASELTSWIPLADRNQIVVRDEIARGPDGQPLASPEDVVVTMKPKKNGEPTNISVRGVTPRAYDVRSGITIVQGRTFKPGLYEIIVGDKIANRIQGLDIGSSVKLQKHDWTVVGVFSSQGGAFESEIWGDADVMAVDFGRTGGTNAMAVRLRDASQVEALDRWIRSNPQMQLQAVSEKKYYDDQAGPLAKALRILATFVAVIMGIGAVFGAVNTMYAIVAARTREIGTLRALGFSRRAILFSFVVESVTLALIGGAIGCVLAFPMNGYSTGTGQTQSFSEIAFAFRITPVIVAVSMVFAVVMGLVGGLAPAFRAARLPITSALREA
jgi:putative ABC transport system permease protein